MPIDPLVLYTGAQQPPTRTGSALDEGADIHHPTLDWDLAPLELAEGVTLELVAEAEDYRPGVGRTTAPRRVTIISAEEFNERVADAQSQLLRDLQRALEAEREAREKTRDIANGQIEEDTLLDRLATLGFDQRRVAELIADPQRGVQQQATRLLDELTNNRVERPGLASQLRRIAEQTSRLAKQPLPEAARAVTDARRSAESQATERLAQSLAAADEKQTEVIDSIEKLTEEMAEWSDLEQFARELAELAEKQRQLRDTTENDAAKTASGRRSPAARSADRKRIAEGQAELGRRFDKLMRAMARRLEAAENSDNTAEQAALDPVADTLDEAEERATTGKLRDATRQIHEGRLGRAGEAQEEAIEDLQQLLSTLRNRASSDPAELAKQLRDAQQRLQNLQQQLEQLEREAADPRHQASREERLSKQTERLGRRLDRLTADEAAQSTQQGANELADASQQSESGEEQQGARESRRNAEEQLEQAERQIAERIQQLENEMAQRLLDQLAADVAAYMQRQHQLLEQTVDLADRLPVNPKPEAAGVDQSKSLAKHQQTLEEKVAQWAEKIAKVKVFSLALRAAADEMDSAAERLAAIDPGRATQNLELSAIGRLKRIADALEQTPPEEPQDSQGGSGEGGEQPPQEPPPFDVAELKLLRIMQLDLNARTRQFEQQLAQNPPKEPDLLDKQQAQAEKLSREQRELADLVQELLDRNNKDPRLDAPQETL